MRTTHAPPVAAGDGFYQPGDIVELISGGVEMTVVDTCNECGEVDVAFFIFGDEGGAEFVRDSFPAICLDLAS